MTKDHLNKRPSPPPLPQQSPRIRQRHNYTSLASTNRSSDVHSSVGAPKPDTLTTSIWKNQQPPTVFLQGTKNHKYWTAVRHYTRYRSKTNNKLTFFQQVSVFSDGKQTFKPWPIVLFGALLLRLETNSPHTHSRHYRVQRSLELEALNHSTAYKDHASASYVQLTGRRIHSPRFDNDIVAKHDVESYYISLALNGYAHFWYSRELYLLVTRKLNPMP